MSKSAHEDSVVYNSIKQKTEEVMLASLRKHFGQQKAYNQTAVATWISQCQEDMLNNLLKLCRNFKYLLNTQVMQTKPGGGQGDLKIDGSCFWNSGTDGQSIVKFEHADFVVIVSLFGVAL